LTRRKTNRQIGRTWRSGHRGQKKNKVGSREKPETSAPGKEQCAPMNRAAWRTEQETLQHTEVVGIHHQKRRPKGAKNRQREGDLFASGQSRKKKTQELVPTGHKQKHKSKVPQKEVGDHSYFAEQLAVTRSTPPGWGKNSAKRAIPPPSRWNSMDLPYVRWSEGADN